MKYINFLNIYIYIYACVCVCRCVCCFNRGLIRGLPNMYWSRLSLHVPVVYWCIHIPTIEKTTKSVLELDRSIRINFFFFFIYDTHCMPPLWSLKLNGKLVHKRKHNLKKIDFLFTMYLILKTKRHMLYGFYWRFGVLDKIPRLFRCLNL